MSEAENANADTASKGSGCGCASKAAALPAEAAKPGCCGGGHDHAGHATTVRDPVCGMTIDPAKSPHRFAHRGETYHFCSAGCRTKFAADPQTYLDKTAPKAAVPEGTIYTCPMHAQIRQVGPGSCPICGMALEPLDASLSQAEDNHEYKAMLHRFWVSSILSVPLLFITMGGENLFHSALAQGSLPWLEFALATPVVLWGAWPFFVRFGQ